MGLFKKGILTNQALAQKREYYIKCPWFHGHCMKAISVADDTDNLPHGLGSTLSYLESTSLVKARGKKAHRLYECF